MNIDSESKIRLYAIIGLALCLFASALSWMLMKMGSIWAELDFGGGELEYWVVSAYLICEVGMIPLVGKLIDRFGERRLLVYGAVTFVVGAIACGLSNSMELLVTFRCIQGLGAGILFTVAFTAVGTLYKNNHRGTAHEIMTAAFAVGSLYGTMVGYWFVFNLSWRYSFFLTAAIVAVGSIIAYHYLPEREGSKDYDIAGAAVLSAVFFAVMIYTQLVNNNFFFISIESLLSILIILALAALLYFIEIKASDPAFPIHMDKVHAKCMLIMFLACLCGIGLLQYLMKVFILHYGLDIYQASAMFFILLIGGATTSVVGCRKVTVTGLRPWIVGGSALLIFGFILLSLIGNSGLVQMGVCLFVLGLGLGCMVTEILCCMQSISPKKDMGTYTSNTMGLRMVGIAVGNVLFSYYILSEINKLASDYGIEFKGDALDIINYIIIFVTDFTDQAIIVFDNAVLACALIAGLAFFLIGIIGHFVKRSDLEYAEQLPDNKE